MDTHQLIYVGRYIWEELNTQHASKPTQVIPM